MKRLCPSRETSTEKGRRKRPSLARVELQKPLPWPVSIDYLSLASILSPTSGQEKLYSNPQDAKKDKHELAFNPKSCRQGLGLKRDDLAVYLHLTLCKEYHINAADKWYDHVIETPLPSYGTCLPIQTRTGISANCPDVVAKNNRDNKSTLID